MTTRLLPISQSTDLVTYQIQVNGNPLPQHYPLYGIEVISEVNRIPTATLMFADGDAATGEWSLSSEDYFVPGSEVSVLAGYHSEDETIFSGIVVSQSIRVRKNRLELQVLCKNSAIAMTTTKKSRHFRDMTDSDSVSEILTDYEHVEEGIITDTEVTHTDLVQYDATDWDFIVMRMEANGLVSTLDERGLNAIVPSIDAAPIATIQFGASVIEFDGNIDARRQFGSVTTQAWDPANQDKANGESTQALWTTNGNLDAADLAASVGADIQTLRHSGALSTEELQQWSDAALLRSKMSFARGRVRVKGFAAARPGTVVELAGFGNRFNGNVWIAAVRHEVSQGDWLTDIEFGMPEEWHAEKHKASTLPANGLLAAVSGLHTGVVTALEGDPLSEYRIRVKIPAIDLESEGIWARLATLDAGNGRGSVFFPDVDDEVIVGFLNDDPRHPVILGMLHSSALPSPEEATEDNFIRGFYSKSGVRILFDDETTTLTMDTPAGHALILDDDAGEIKLVDSNGNTLLMSSSGILIESASDLVLKASGNVTVEGQTNLELKAGAQWKAEGSAGAEISSSAITVVKGSLVQIN